MLFNRIIKNLFKISFILIFIFIFTSFSYAKNNVNEIYIDVSINNFGMATIKHKWIGYFDEGTEIYLPINTKDFTIKNLHVSKDNREYKNVEKWNTKDTFFNKSYRCGLNKDNNITEICFGISEYGNNTYEFSYDVDPFIKSYNDFNGFNFQFINPNMSIFPTNISVNIKLDNYYLTTENSKIWAFGFEGSAYINDGIATVVSNNSLKNSNYVNIMMSFNKTLLTPNHKVNGTFNELVYNVAMTDSDYLSYKRENFIKKLVFFLIIASVFLAIFIPIFISVMRKIRLKNFYKNVNYYRDTPNNSNISISYVLYTDFNIWNNKRSNIIGAIITKMINDKNLIPIKNTKYGIFGNEKVSTSLKIGSEPKEKIIKDLYDIIVNAADNDGILQENELKKYSESNYNLLNNYYESIRKDGIDSLNKLKAYTKILSNDINGLSEIGKKELAQIYGLRKFLEEFTLIKERSIAEGVIWENLLVYATLFGIATKVTKELKKIYPDKIYYIDNYNDTIYISDIFYKAMYSNNFSCINSLTIDKYSKMAASSGLGGDVSIGGGGGFSGGGFGGGTR